MTIINTTLSDWWIETTLGEVCDFINRWVTPKYSKEWILLYNQKCIRDWKIFKKDSRFLESSQRIMEEKFLKDLDILVCSTWVWTLWRVGQIKDVKIPTTVDSHVSIIRVNDKNSKYYIWYWLKSKEKYIEGLAEWSTGQTELPREKIKNIPLLLPPLPEQQAIAKILSSFDDKIELLREQNETLEKMAQTIFEEWFGKYSIDDELPEGWRVGKITEIIQREALSYRCDKKDLDIKWNTPIIDQGTNGLYWYTSREPDFKATKENPVLVFTNHTCNYWFIDYPFCAIQNVLPYRWKNEYDVYFLYFMTKWSITFIEYKWHWPDFEAKDFIIPIKEKAREFSNLAKPVLEKISINNSQIQTLSKTRDELLPKFMKGEVRVV